MSALSAVDLRLGLADVAALALVQRPVVSVWRTRSTGTDHPFPAPVETLDGQEWFDGRQVVEWLEATGRGNNPEARADLAAFASIDGGSPAGDQEVFFGLTALLCLTAIVGSPFGETAAGDILDLADEADPDNDLLFGEIEELGGRIGALAHYCDLLVDAAYHPAAALEKLIGERFRRHVPAQSTVALTGPAHELIGSAAIALADGAGHESLTVVDPTPGGSDLLLAVAERAGARDLTVFTGRSNDAAARLARRRLRVHGVHRADGAGSDASGDQPDQAILLARYPSPGQPDVAAAEMLNAVTDLLLGTTPQQRFLVTAPAAVLTDRLRDPGARMARDRLIRFPTLRAVVRLPAGLVAAKPRERLALMLFGRRHDPSPDEPQMLVGDLSNAALSSAAIDDLVTDLVASTSSPAIARTHLFRFLRPVMVRRVLATAGSIVEVVGPGQARPASGADLVLRITEIAEGIARPLAAPTVPEMAVASHIQNLIPITTLGAAKDRGDIRILAGLRLDTGLGPGGVILLGEAEVCDAGRVGDRTVDRLAVIARHPAVRFTEPGDVVFTSSPRPGALVDTNGSAVVTYPARIARIARPDSGLAARLLAADIIAQPEGAKAWRGWPLRRLPSDQATVLDQALAEIEEYRVDLERRRQDAEELARLLARGATDGAVTLTTTTEPTKGT